MSKCPFKPETIVMLNAHDLDPGSFQFNIWKQHNNIQEFDDGHIQFDDTYYRTECWPIDEHNTRIKAWFKDPSSGLECLSIDRIVWHYTMKQHAEMAMHRMYHNKDDHWWELWSKVDRSLIEYKGDWKRKMRQYGLNGRTLSEAIAMDPHVYDEMNHNPAKAYTSAGKRFLRRVNLLFQIADRHTLIWTKDGRSDPMINYYNLDIVKNEIKKLYESRHKEGERA